MNPESIEKINQLKIFSEICVVPIKINFLVKIFVLIKTHKDRKMFF